MNARRLRILVTAGPTREHLDPVRYLSNVSSGAMGFALAEAARRRGHDVVLIHGPAALKPPDGVRAVAVVSAAQMLAACRSAWPRCDALLMAAAVADYTPARPRRVKIKKTAAALHLRLTPTADILRTLSHSRRPGQLVIGFALEDRDARRRARDKLLRKRLDAVVLNGPRAIGAARASVEVLLAGGRWRQLGPASKTALADRIVALTERLRTSGGAAGMARARPSR